MILSARKLCLEGISAFAALMLIFTLCDLTIAIHIYNPDSAFGRFFEIVGTLPMPVVGIFSCAALIMTARRELCLSTAVSFAVGGLLLMYFCFYAYRSMAHTFSRVGGVMLVGMAIWAATSFYLTDRIVRKGNGTALRRASIIAVVGCAVAVEGVMLIKMFMSRPRFRNLTDPLNEFTLWFQRQPYTDASINSSFPSGHSAQAALSFCLLLIPMFVKFRRSLRFKYYFAAFSFAAAFTLCVMVSRMILGAHYATDVLVGAALPIVSMLAAAFLTDRCTRKAPGAASDRKNLEQGDCIKGSSVVQ